MMLYLAITQHSSPTIFLKYYPTATKQHIDNYWTTVNQCQATMKQLLNNKISNDQETKNQEIAIMRKHIMNKQPIKEPNH